MFLLNPMHIFTKLIFAALTLFYTCYYTQGARRYFLLIFTTVCVFVMVVNTCAFTEG